MLVESEAQVTPVHENLIGTQGSPFHPLFTLYFALIAFIAVTAIEITYITAPRGNTKLMKFKLKQRFEHPIYNKQPKY